MYQVALKNSAGVVVHVDTVETKCPYDAIERARYYAQLPYCQAEAYDIDDLYDSAPVPVASTECAPEPGHFRKIA